ncbi:ubiquitin-protein ligase (E3) [Hypoxylon texense]
MFPTFTGSSRRPRNVNLSGQRNTNPWATSSWSPSTSGASKTVAQAQAEREKRQRERDELNAAKKLQRVWRGHRGRQSFKQTCRERYDALYGQPVDHDSSQRVTSALPLLLLLFDPAQTDDQHRLDLFIQDLVTLKSDPSNFRIFDPSSWDRFAQLLIGALERRPASLPQALLSVLLDIVRRRQPAITPIIDRYYKLLAKYFEQNSQLSISAEQREILIEAATVPLEPNPEQGLPILRAYQAFAFSFLSSSSLSFLQQDPIQIARRLDLQTLSQSVIDAYSGPERTNTLPKNRSLWLLAHFIALNRSNPTSQGSKYLEALYLQLSLLVDDIRVRYGRHGPHDETDSSFDVSELGDNEADDSVPFSTWMVDQLNFLVDEDGISELLSRFTSTISASDRLSEEASLLAGYTLVLLRCFPSHSDDIKMRLFQGDISTTGPSGSAATPSVKYFWKAASNTDVFRDITQPKAQQQPSFVVALLRPDSTRDREWRTILLFLELYNFLLRVTDDEDFLPAETQLLSEQSPATLRIRSSSLGLAELKELINFLKSLSFPLYYNLPMIMPSHSRLPRISIISGKPDTEEEVAHATQTSFAGIIGMDVLSLRSVSTTTMRSLYERDSRRRFLPADFWLMTSKFDMNGFISAVVLEEQQKDQMEEGEGGSDDDSDVDTRDTFHSFTAQRLSRAARIEQRRRLRRVQREQLLAQVGPKLEILRNMPFVIPFEVRVQIFRQFVYLDKAKRRGGNVDADRWRLSVISGEGGFNNPSARGRDILGRHTAKVKRGHVFDDAYEQFYSLGEGLKEPIQITFVDRFDQPEAGIDGGGVTKEFLTSITDEAFSPGSDGHNLFVTNDQNLLYPNPTAFDDLAEMLRYYKLSENDAKWREHMADLAKRYEFLGRVVGKCMYEGILIDKAFAGFFLLKWSASGQGSLTDYRANLNDLRDLDPELYQGLINLKNYPGKVIDLSLDFTITDQVNGPFGAVRTITRPLCKNGEDIPVTNTNRPLYISYVTNHRLVAQPYRQTRAFLKGLGSIINPAWLSMFNQSELQRLVGGDSSEIDVEDLRRNTQYSGLYAIGDDGLEHPTIQLFWQVMHEFRDSERREVLKYVTSTPRAPLLGFSQLSPHFSIRDGGTDEERLPSTSTCVNLLKLPRYSSKETLKSKLLYAIQSGAGFDLS